MIKLNNVSKSFDGKIVIDDFSYIFEDGEKYALIAPSGLGKTTLINLITSLIKPDKGDIIYSKKDLSFSPVFQEDRLFEELSSVMNIKITTKIKDEGYIREELGKLLPTDELDKPVSLLSGGMKRRLCIVRSILCKSDVIILDEPFTGLDEDNINIAFSYILSNLDNRTLIMTSHNFQFPNDFKVINLIK